ncbi:Immunoglobulin superfamily DCC subclass member 4 [Liparis tanakae]|nr:Immunoglobulin superfamily DCC subclass member 4 [Liparis tanakae]
MFTDAFSLVSPALSAQEILLGALRPFTRYELAVQSNGVDAVGPFSGTVQESTFADRESLRLHFEFIKHKPGAL